MSDRISAGDCRCSVNGHGILRVRKSWVESTGAENCSHLCGGGQANSDPAVVAQMTTACIAQAILLEVSLSLLGLGVTEPTPAREFLRKGAYSFDLDKAIPRASSQPFGWQIAWPREHERSQRHDDPRATAAGPSPDGLPPLHEVITLGPDTRAGACMPRIERSIAMRLRTE